MTTQPSLDAMQDLHGRNLDLMARASQSLAESAQMLGRELSEFVSGRLMKDMEAMQRFSRCRTPDELFHEQCGFFEEAVNDYTVEASQVMRIAADVSLNAARPFEDMTERTLREMKDMRDQAANDVKRQTGEAVNSVQKAAPGIAAD